MFAAVLFDFNGVLVDDEPLHCRLVCEIAAEYAGIVVTHEEYFRRYTGIPDRECFEAVWRDAHRALDPELLETMVALKAQRYLKAAAGSDLFFPGAIEVLRTAAACCPIAIVSGALRPEVDLALSRAGLNELPSVLVTAEDVARGKPDPGPYLAAVQALASAAHCTARPAAPMLAIEDTEPGVASARAAGLRVLAVGHTTPRELLVAADVYVSRIGDVDLEQLAREL